jgi:hypothetical protein
MPAFIGISEIFNGISRRIIAKIILFSGFFFNFIPFSFGVLFLFRPFFLIWDFNLRSNYLILFGLRVAILCVIFLFTAVEIFKIILWLFTFSFLKLTFLFFFKGVTYLLVHYIKIPFFLWLGFRISLFSFF